MASKFKIGDKVIVNSHKGKIIDFKPYCLKYTIKFDNPNLLPSEMDFEESRISIDRDDSVCPICKTQWKILKFNMKTWKDCTKCGKTYEAIMEDVENKKNTPPPLPGSSKYRDNLIKEFELMLDGFDDPDLDISNFKNWSDSDDDEF
jgi:ssDNA-binding Zn-finger/Zn-ribbon topoisomerase 1